jgi:hypothetical protein
MRARGESPKSDHFLFYGLPRCYRCPKLTLRIYPTWVCTAASTSQGMHKAVANVVTAVSQSASFTGGEEIWASGHCWATNQSR